MKILHSLANRIAAALGYQPIPVRPKNSPSIEALSKRIKEALSRPARHSIASEFDLLEDLDDALSGLDLANSLHQIEIMHWRNETKRAWGQAIKAEDRVEVLTELLHEARHNGLIYWSPNTERGAVAQASMLNRIDLALAGLPAKTAGLPSGHELHGIALSALKRLDDWTNENETMWTGWGDQTVPPGAEFWRVKSGQALKALEEIKIAPPREWGDLKEAA